MLLDKGDKLIEEAQACISKNFMKSSFESKCFNQCCFSFGGPGTGGSEGIVKNGLFVDPVPNPFSLKHIPGDGHTPYSAPLWFERDEKSKSGYVGKSLPPFWWPSRFMDKDESPENRLGFQGRSILR